MPITIRESALLADETGKIRKNRGGRFFSGFACQVLATTQSFAYLFNDFRSDFGKSLETCQK